MNFLCVADYIEEFNLTSIYDLDLVETRGEFSRLAIPDTEDCIWVCDACGELSDPDDNDGNCMICEDIYHKEVEDDDENDEYDE